MVRAGCGHITFWVSRCSSPTSVFSFYLLLHGIFHITDNLTLIVVPGESDLTLKPKLKYTIFLEEESVVDGRIYSSRQESLDGLTCRVSSQSSGNKIDLHRPNMSTTYSVGGRSGRSVLDFVTQEGGGYHVACGYDEGQQGPQVVIAVGSGVTEGIFRTVFQSLLAFFGGGILGSAILIVTLIRSSKRNRSGPAQHAV
jgi:hypothetical protein